MKDESIFVGILYLIKGLIWSPLKWTLTLFGLVLFVKGVICFGMWDISYFMVTFEDLTWVRWVFIAFFGFNIYLILSQLTPY